MLLFPDESLQVLNVLENKGIEAWFVGGCVRDQLMGREAHDIDLAVSARWNEVAHACESAGMAVHETGTAHGTVTVINNDMPFEVTTYRADSTSSADARHPDSVSFISSIEEDLIRRDFTINAMAWHPERGLLDPFDGRTDIKCKNIVTVGNPKQRFLEDALRILRACRFASQLGFVIDDRTYDAMLSCKHLLANISTERITYELDRLLLGDHVAQALLDTVDVLSFVLPELVAMKDCPQVTKYHTYDVLEHTAHALENAPAQRLVRWAVLCHDMGKPASAFFDDDGTEHFYGHAGISAKIAQGMMDRLLMSPSFKSDVTTLVSRHSDKIDPTSRSVKRALAKMQGREDLFRSFLALQRADILAHAPECHHQINRIDEIERILNDIASEGEAYKIDHLSIDGNDVISLGIPQGPLVGKMLRLTLDAVIDGNMPNERESLIKFVKSQTKSIRPPSTDEDELS